MRLLILVVVAIFVTSPLRGVMIKSGVNLSSLHPATSLLMEEARGVYAENSFPFVVTSADDGKHGVGSLHFVGLALDFRVRDPGGEWSIPVAMRRQMAAEIGRRVGPQYDVLYEAKPHPHIHGEFQPKK